MDTQTFGDLWKDFRCANPRLRRLLVAPGYIRNSQRRQNGRPFGISSDPDYDYPWPKSGIFLVSIEGVPLIFKPGWWFGTCFISPMFSIYWESSSQLTNIFQRGWNQQPEAEANLKHWSFDNLDLSQGPKRTCMDWPWNCCNSTKPLDAWGFAILVMGLEEYLQPRRTSWDREKHIENIIHSMSRHKWT